MRSKAQHGRRTSQALTWDRASAQGASRESSSRSPSAGQPNRGRTLLKGVAGRKPISSNMRLWTSSSATLCVTHLVARVYGIGGAACPRGVEDPPILDPAQRPLRAQMECTMHGKADGELGLVQPCVCPLTLVSQAQRSCRTRLQAGWWCKGVDGLTFKQSEEPSLDTAAVEAARQDSCLPLMLPMHAWSAVLTWVERQAVAELPRQRARLLQRLGERSWVCAHGMCCGRNRSFGKQICGARDKSTRQHADWPLQGCKPSNSPPVCLASPAAPPSCRSWGEAWCGEGGQW